MGDAALGELKATLESMGPTRHWKSRPVLQKELKKALGRVSVELSAPQQKALLAAVSERDEEAEVCRDTKGHQEPDADLRDTENVPLREDVDVYFKREVLPHGPEAWIDHEKDEGGIRNPFQLALLQVRAAAPPRRD